MMSLYTYQIRVKLRRLNLRLCLLESLLSVGGIEALSQTYSQNSSHCL